MVFGANRHFAAILLRDMTNRLHAETMPMLIVALGGAQIAFRILLQSGIVIILNTDNNASDRAQDGLAIRYFPSIAGIPDAGFPAAR